MITGTTEVFGCIAHPTSHVRAPQLFNKVFAERNLDKVMVPVDIPPEEVEAAISGLKALGNFTGAAVTIPHKLTLASHCDRLSPAARITGAVNAVRFTDEHQMVGDNFDGPGFVAGVLGENPLGLETPRDHFCEKRILMLGAGGASRAIAAALSKQDVAALHILNRNQSRADEVVSLVKEIAPDMPIETVTGAALNKDSYDMVINATPLGLSASDPLPISLDGFAAHCLICDIIMKPERTSWLADAELRGLKTHYGRHMLDYQLPLIAEFIGAYSD